MARIAADGKPSSIDHWRRERLVAGSIDFNVGEGQAVREYTTDSGPADYMLFLDRKPVGVTEAKKETLGHKNEEDPKSVLQQFRNEYHPRIAVTVDMIATS